MGLKKTIKKVVGDVARTAITVGGIAIIMRGIITIEAIRTANANKLLDFDETDYHRNEEVDPGYRNDHPFIVSISNSFSDYYKHQIVDAIQYVDDVADGLKFIVVLGESTDADIIITPSKDLDDKKYLGSANKSTGEVLISNDQIHVLGVKATVIHELGHILGLEHSKEYTSMMYPVSIRTRFSKEDINNLNTIWPAGEENDK